MCHSHRAEQEEGSNPHREHQLLGVRARRRRGDDAALRRLRRQLPHVLSVPAAQGDSQGRLAVSVVRGADLQEADGLVRLHTVQEALFFE